MSEEFEIIDITQEEANEYQKKIGALVRHVLDTNKQVQDFIIEENQPIEMRINGILSIADDLAPWDSRMFDYFVGSVARERPRVKGRMLDTQAVNIPQNKLGLGICNAILNSSGMSRDFNLTVKNTKNLRLHLYSVYGQNSMKSSLTLAIRVVNREIPTWEDLNLPKLFRDTITHKSGLVLVSGPVGSGKSTTVASLINRLNLSANHRRSVLTIENPIEYVHNSSSLKIVQKDVGVNTPSYSRATEDALRENADIVVIGELRNKEEMDNALRLAEVGKLVFATIHSNSVVDTPDRFVNMFPGDVQANIRERLASNVICIIHQNLEIIGDKQYPSVEGFFARNQNEREQVRSRFSRADLGKLMTSGESFVVSRKRAFEELDEHIDFGENKEIAYNRLVKNTNTIK